MKTYQTVFIIAVVAVVLGLGAVIVVARLPPPGWELWAKWLVGLVVSLIVFFAALSQFTGYSLKDVLAGRRERGNVAFLLRMELQRNQERLEGTTSDGRSVLLSEAWNLGRRSWGLEQPLVSEMWDRFGTHPVVLGLPKEIVEGLHRYYQGIGVLNRRFEQLSENRKKSVAADFFEALRPTVELGGELIGELPDSDSAAARRPEVFGARLKPWWQDPGWWQVILEVLAIVVAIAVATPLISSDGRDVRDVAPSVSPTSTYAAPTETPVTRLTPVGAWRPGVTQLDLEAYDKYNEGVRLTLENVAVEAHGFKVFLTIESLGEQSTLVEYRLENIVVNDDAGKVYEPCKSCSSISLWYVSFYGRERVTGYVDFGGLSQEARRLTFRFPPFPPLEFALVADGTPVGTSESVPASATSTRTPTQISTPTASPMPTTE